MGAAYSISDLDASVFQDADDVFDELKGRLSAEWLELEHDEVERSLEMTGRELLRRLFQSHLHVRHLRETVRPHVLANGVRRTHRRIRVRSLSTIFGKVQVYRTSYSARGESSICPLDEQLNLPVDSFSFELRRRAADLAITTSFDDTTRRLREATGTRVAKRQVEQLVQRAAHDFEAFYAQREAPRESAELLILSIDRKGVVVRHDDLREKTRQAAEQKKPALDKRRAVGERRNRKRMAMVAAVYTVKPWMRTAEDVVAGLEGDEVELAPRPRPEGKRIWASVERKADEVVEQAFQEALARDPEQQKHWVFLVDGDRHQLYWLRQAAKRHRIRATFIIDIIHVIEYLWIGARGFHEPYSSEAQEWVRERLLKILMGRAGWVAGGMRRAAKQRGLSKEKRARVKKCADYLKNYSAMMRYDLALAAGLPIATGVIEGACRYLIGDRLDITGARWGIDGAEAVLRLRALRASGDFDEYWSYHRAQEQLRNYGSAHQPHLRLVSI